MAEAAAGPRHQRERGVVVSHSPAKCGRLHVVNAMQTHPMIVLDGALMDSLLPRARGLPWELGRRRLTSRP